MDLGMKEQEAVQGDWVLVSGERDGIVFPESDVEGTKRTFTGDKFLVTKQSERVASGTFRLDPSKQPKEVNVKLDGADKPVQGIYALEGETLKICYGLPGVERPKEFGTKVGSGHIFGVWKRAKQ